MRPMKIEEDNGFVLINGHRVAGFVGENICEQCGQPNVYADEFDSFFCPGCNKWTEQHPVCTDPNCPYCNKIRPDRPLPIDSNETKKD